MRAIGWSNPEQFLAPDDQKQQMPPEMMKAIEELKILQKEADAKEAVAQASIADSQSEAQARMIDAQTRRMLAEGLVSLLASDAHNTKSRPPLLSEAFSVAEAELMPRDGCCAGLSATS